MSFRLTILRLIAVFGISFTTGYLIGKKTEPIKHSLKNSLKIINTSV